MKHSAILINTARSELVKKSALVNAVLLSLTVNAGHMLRIKLFMISGIHLRKMQVCNKIFRR